jgi:tyrosyl-tRNA synthetase
MAYEVTKLVHGKEEADKVIEATNALFNGNLNLDNVPTFNLSISDLGINIMDLCVKTNFLTSKSDARRLITQGGLTLNDEKVNDINLLVDHKYLKDNYLLLKKGKKNFLKVIFK